MYFYLLSISELTRRSKARRSVQRNLGEIDKGMSKGRSKDYTIENALVVHWLGLDTFTALAWVQSLVRKLVSHKICGTAKKEKKKGLHYEAYKSVSQKLSELYLFYFFCLLSPKTEMFTLIC